MVAEDVTQALRSTENAIRDYIALILSSVYGPDWEAKLGVPAAKIETWRTKRDSEVRRNPAADSRVLFYADFGDLPSILEAHWGHFQDGFGEKQRFMTALGELRILRNTEAHGRGFFPHEIHLILGFSDRIRTTIAMARSKIDSLEEHFARIESVRDSLGFTRVPKGPAPARRIVRVGDVIEFTVAAIDTMATTGVHLHQFGPAIPRCGRKSKRRVLVNSLFSKLGLEHRARQRERGLRISGSINSRCYREFVPEVPRPGPPSPLLRAWLGFNVSP